MVDRTIEPPSRRAAPAWILALWAAQLVVAFPLLGVGVYRLVLGPRAGVLVVSAFAVGLVWAAGVITVLAAGRGRAWLGTMRYQLLLAFVTSSFSFLLLGEIAVRALAERDPDGNLYFRGHHLRPFRPPLSHLRSSIENLQNESTMVIPHDLLGWVTRPGASGAMAAHNSSGIRVADPSREYSRRAPDGTLRIAVFGDSFTYGAEVATSDCWAHRTEELLREHGVAAEVLNFGVNGYGTDQAYLRWQHEGATYSPHVVVLGLQMENTDRNVNIIRVLYNPDSALPFSKPRFVLNPDGLRLHNQPCLTSQQVLETLQGIDGWELLSHEYHYREADYHPPFWFGSKLIACLAALAEESIAPKSDYPVEAPAVRLTMEILNRFRDQVEAAGSRFVVLHLPKKGALEHVVSSGSLPYHETLRRIREQFDVVSTSEALAAAADESSLDELFAPKNHYSPRGNSIVAHVLADHLAARRP